MADVAGARRVRRVSAVDVFLLTYSQDKVVVGLVVDGVQDVKHLDGEV